MERPVAAFDVDGTLYRSNLLVDLAYQLVNQATLPYRIIDEFRDAQKEWKARRHWDSFVQYMDLLIATYVRSLRGLSAEEVCVAARQVVNNSPESMYVYGRNLIDQLTPTHKLVAISGSPIEVVAPFVKQLGIDEVYATTFETEGGVYTGEVIQVGTREKGLTLKRMVERLDLTFVGSTGIGDTDSDIPMLDLVTSPRAFHPNKELFKHALDRGWEIIYEVKDMNLHLGQQGSFSIEDNFGHFRQNN